MTHRVPLAAAAVLATLLAAGCGSGAPIRPIASGDELATLDDEEARLWKAAEDFDRALANSRQLYPDPALQSYVQSLMERLYPELGPRLRVRLLKSPEINAFALPNGSVYVNLGLLARADSEAQLAIVLAHEGAHFVGRHAWRQRRTVKSASAFALGVALVGIPLVGDLLAASSMYGYSRELEREADALGAARMRRVGLDIADGARMFEHLHAEMRALDLDEPVFFASHPRLQERIESYRELAAQHPGAGGDAGRGDFLELTAGARADSLAADLSRNRYESLLLVLEAATAARRYPEHVRDYYLGEALLRRGGEGDAERAVRAWRAALASAPEYAPPYRALGFHHLKAGRPAEARPLLARYLALAPDAADRAYVAKYLEEMGR